MADDQYSASKYIAEQLAQYLLLWWWVWLRAGKKLTWNLKCLWLRVNQSNDIKCSVIFWEKRLEREKVLGLKVSKFMGKFDLINWEVLREYGLDLKIYASYRGF